MQQQQYYYTQKEIDEYATFKCCVCGHTDHYMSMECDNNIWYCPECWYGVTQEAIVDRKNVLLKASLSFLEEYQDTMSSYTVVYGEDGVERDIYELIEDIQEELSA